MLKKRAKDVLDALDDNNQQMKRVQQEKAKVGVLLVLALDPRVALQWSWRNASLNSPSSVLQAALLALMFAVVSRR